MERYKCGIQMKAGTVMLISDNIYNYYKYVNINFLKNDSDKEMHFVMTKYANLGRYFLLTQ